MSDELTRSERHAKIWLLMERHRDVAGNVDTTADSPCEVAYREWLAEKSPPTNWRSISVKDFDDYLETKKPRRAKGQLRLFQPDVELVQSRKRRVTVKERDATRQQWLLYLNTQEETKRAIDEDHAEETRYVRTLLLEYQSDSEKTVDVMRRAFGWNEDEDAPPQSEAAD